MSNDHVELIESEWFKTRPTVIQTIILKTPPYQRYTLAGKGCYIMYSYNEDGTVTCIRQHEARFEYGVFGIDPKELEPIVEH